MGAYDTQVMYSIYNVVSRQAVHIHGPLSKLADMAP
jgi:hypothetical protein